ncbi:DEAD/DEAH box helicase [Enterococcus columbae]|uniref:DEAD/DEAH box helicase n=1 Tax=Enterococcus columbae DSM 7374 = ATCC 51263 TaxID=1121865 RepID=S1NEH6_9ENTE|nr:DEAD/DEAH box helicase [Enterococcus columbae]EOT44654.1 hypothetical protein OMW_00710 [Enterococcus columbae DSM 7374 = ATCC 51263]EOW87450.1 hypothetical protein I568_00494 [Enterococcus columbae DSM 7374 = ATCC 51263]
MLIENTSKYFLKKIRAKAKMYEYGVPKDIHIKVEEQANDLILLCIGIVGDIADEICKMKELPINLSSENKDKLYFASKFFDSYFQSKMDLNMNPYHILMASVTYYFCNMNGSSKVMMTTMPKQSDFNFYASGLEKLIMWLLNDDIRFDINDIDAKYIDYARIIVDYHNSFFECKNPEEPNFEELRNFVYQIGNYREILFVDIILAIVKKKVYNSCINLMPLYSDINKEHWFETFKNNKMIKEMWPSQILLGEENIYSGKSGVIQMPTSSGKTTSVALTIQSAFLSGRTSIAIIVAPFRALCKEIMFDMEKFFEFDDSITITEFSDIPELNEMELATLESINKKVFVMTPEKLAYILKHNQKITESIGMIIFDEAHLFDDEKRGTDYELLLASINNYIKPNAQKLLISAVISNANQLNDWINNEGVVIRNNAIKASEKTVAFNKFTSFNSDTVYSNLYFVDLDKYLEEEFYVPRVVQILKLNKKGAERKNRYFPDFKNKQDVGIYYSIKLVTNGSVAIFCSKKDTVNKILLRFIDLKERGISFDNFNRVSNELECLKIANLIREHLGGNELYTAALNGIIGHHAGIPNGIRIAEEYALKKALVRCVVCTSTLAQGVNLPIKYLIVSSIYQSNHIIKVRDFHNLIGRTARAGKETEGTIILTEDVYKNEKKGYQFNNYKHLLNADNSEECSSNLLKLVRNIDLDNKRYISSDYIKKYITLRYSSYADFNNLRNKIFEFKEKEKKYGVAVFEKMNDIEHILVSLENFILDFLDAEDDSLEIIQSTYGYFLANEDEKKELKNIYDLIKSNINQLEVSDKLIYKKSMIGIMRMQKLSKFIDDNLYEIVNADFDILIKLISGRLKEIEDCKIIPKLFEKEYVYELLKMWLDGTSYLKIWEYATKVKLKVRRGKNSRGISLEDIVLLCDSDFGYSSLTIIQAIIEILNTKDCGENIQRELNEIIQRIRYGVPNKATAYIYELGFADRIISQKLFEVIKDFNCDNKKQVKNALKKNKEEIKKILNNYPSYYMNRLELIR